MSSNDSLRKFECEIFSHYHCNYVHSISKATPLVAAVASKMSSTPTQLCLLRNYNYGGGEMADSFTIDPNEARKRLGLEHDDITGTYTVDVPKVVTPIKCAPRTGKGSRYPGNFLLPFDIRSLRPY